MRFSGFRYTIAHMNTTHIMNKENITQIINEFLINLQNSICMEDRRDSVYYLSKHVGKDRANSIAEFFGLTNSYYKVKIQ